MQLMFSNVSLDSINNCLDRTADIKLKMDGQTPQQQEPHHEQ